MFLRGVLKIEWHDIFIKNLLVEWGNGLLVHYEGLFTRMIGVVRVM